MLSRDPNEVHENIHMNKEVNAVLARVQTIGLGPIDAVGLCWTNIIPVLIIESCLNQRKKYNLAGKPVHKLDTGKQWNIYQFFEILGL